MNLSLGLPNLEKIKEYARIAEVGDIARRYLAMNAFDGILTMIGVVMGAYIAGVHDTRIVLATGLATSLAMGISGLWGAYMTETAERERDLRELEQAMLTDLGDTEQARASLFASIVVALIDGLAPLAAGILVLSPFLFANLVDQVHVLYIAALAIALVQLFALGAFLAKVGHSNLLRSGARMIVAGLVCVVVSLVLNGVA